MHPDIEKAIDLIDHKIAELQKAKRTLLDVFGEGNIALQPGIPRLIKRKPLTRREAVINLIKNEGPQSRSEILNKTHIPIGTVASILNDKKAFMNKEGKWHLIGREEEEKEKGLTQNQ
jgi:hypothetical protein